MASIQNPTSADLSKALAGASYLMYGEAPNTSAYANLPPSVVQTMLNPMYTGIEANIAQPGKRPATAADALSATTPTTAKRAKDTLLDIIKQTRDFGVPTTPDQTEALRSAMYMSGFDVNFDDPRFTEKAAFEQFATAYEQPGATLQSIRDDNVITPEEAAVIAKQQAVEAAHQQELAAEQEVITNQLKAGLIFSGYLDPIKAQNPDEVVFAMDALLKDHNNELDVYTEINKSFDIENGYAPTQDSLALVSRLTEGQVDMNVYDDYFSDYDAYTDPAGSAKATYFQSYMDLKGMDWEAANAIATGDLTIPKSILMPDGTADFGQVMIAAAHGTMPLPTSQEDLAKLLTADELAAYNAMPAQSDDTVGMSREQLLAHALTDPDMSRYNQYLEMENARRNPDFGPKPEMMVGPDVMSGGNEPLWQQLSTGNVAPTPIPGAYVTGGIELLDEDLLAPTVINAASEASRNTFQLDWSAASTDPVTEELRKVFAQSAAGVSTVNVSSVTFDTTDVMKSLKEEFAAHAAERSTPVAPATPAKPDLATLMQSGINVTGNNKPSYAEMMTLPLAERANWLNNQTPEDKLRIGQEMMTSINNSNNNSLFAPSSPF